MAGDTSVLGIGLGIFAYGLFSVHDASIKWLVAELPVWQVLFCRSLVIVLTCLAIGRRSLLEQAAATSLKMPLLFRGLITLVAWLCYFTASRSLPLAQLLTLYFAAPLVVTVLAIRLLQERVTRARWASVIVGFLGVMLASDPFGVRASIATLLVLIAAVLWGYGIILMRQIARRESTMLQMLATNLVFLIGTGIMCAFSWRTPDVSQAALLISVAAFGGLGQFCLFEAARMTPASVMATVEYTSLPWAFLLGYAIWGDIPTAAVFSGAGLILLAGGILVVAERSRAVMRQRTGG
jgi:drug/metabolite transporter (DMT)-like permease